MIWLSVIKTYYGKNITCLNQILIYWDLLSHPNNKNKSSIVLTS
jgi:hypothetical protein